MRDRLNLRQVGFFEKIFAIFVCILLVILCVKGLQNNISYNTLTFESFLNYLSNAPTVTPSFSISDFTIKGDWGVFKFLRDFLNLFTNLLGGSIFLASYVMNVLHYIIYFFRFLFI